MSEQGCDSFGNEHARVEMEEEKVRDMAAQVDGMSTCPSEEKRREDCMTSQISKQAKGLSGSLYQSPGLNAGEREISGLMYSCEHTSVSRLFVITEYEQNRCQKKEIVKIIIKNTFSYFSWPVVLRKSWKNTSGFPNFFCMSCSSAVREVRGLNEHLLYPLTVCTEEHRTTFSASLAANYFSCNASPLSLY